jgi:hypothetical protein
LSPRDRRSKDKRRADRARADAFKRQRWIERRQLVDADGRPVLVLRTDGAAWADLHSDMPPEFAERVVRDLRADGTLLWLAPQDDGTVRCRMLHPGEPPEEMVRFLAEHMRPIAKAVARLGPDDPPANNPYGDKPLPPAGRWDWLDR